MKWILIPLALALTACDPTPAPQPETEGRPNPAFETQVRAMEKARAVEQQMKDTAATQRKTLDATTQ